MDIINGNIQIDNFSNKFPWLQSWKVSPKDLQIKQKDCLLYKKAEKPGNTVFMRLWGNICTYRILS